MPRRDLPHARALDASLQAEQEELLPERVDLRLELEAVLMPFAATLRAGVREAWVSAIA